MQVRLTTTISTIINVDPANTTQFEVAKREIFGCYKKVLCTDAEQEQIIEAVKFMQVSACFADEVIGTEVTHTFEEVK
jgi:hypothetical protein